MEIALPIELQSLIIQKLPPHSVRLWCDESSHQEAPYIMEFLNSLQPPLSGLRILIGPEGGWSTE